jgi:hypothetical protein
VAAALADAKERGDPPAALRATGPTAQAARELAINSEQRSAMEKKH